MNKNALQSKWSSVKGRIKEKFSKLTEEDISEINGSREVLIDKLRERYDYDVARAEKEVDSLEHSCGCGKGGCGSSKGQ